VQHELLATVRLLATIIPTEEAWCKPHAGVVKLSRATIKICGVSPPPESTTGCGFSRQLDNGGGYEYANDGSNSVVAELVVQTVSGVPYEEYVTTNVFEPCKWADHARRHGGP
jgi:hypothetical protein